MKSSDVRILYGFSAATLVMSIVAIGACGLGIVFVAVAGMHLSSESFISLMSSLLESSTSLGYMLGVHGVDVGSLIELASPLLGVVVLLIVAAAACHVVALIAAVMGIRHCDEPDRLGVAFGLAIIGALLTLIAHDPVVAILLVVMAVFIQRIRDAAGSDAGAN